MADFPKRRFQVFVSSTYLDLKEERQAAVEAILTTGHIPAGMELFTSGDESQMEVIRQWIDESDIYLLILGSRYGSIEPTSGKSYIHLEYEYALNRNMPLFACVVSKEAEEKRVRQYGIHSIEQDYPDKLRKFKDLVCSKMVRFWNDSKDIKIAVHESLSSFARRDDIKGWVRESDQANTIALANELARLSEENSKLHKRIKELSDESLTIAGLKYSEIVNHLKNYKIAKVIALIGDKGRREINVQNLLEFFWYFEMSSAFSKYVREHDSEVDIFLVELRKLDLMKYELKIIWVSGGGFFSDEEPKGVTLIAPTHNGQSFLNRLKVDREQLGLPNIQP